MQPPAAHAASQRAAALAVALAVTLALLTCPGAAAERSLSYDIAYGNVALGKATLRFNDDGAHYRINMSSRSRGPLDNLLRWQAEAASTGRSAGTALLPVKHH